MALSKRERNLTLVVGAVVGILAIDRYALTPILDQQDLLDAKREQISKEMEATQKLFADRKQKAPLWKARVAGGLKNTPGDAETQVFHALKDWSKECGFTLSSVKPERPESKEEMKEVTVQAAGTGTMESVSKLLWKAQSAPFPLKVVDMQLASRTDGSSDLSLQIRFSTLYLPPASASSAAKNEKPGGAK